MLATAKIHILKQFTTYRSWWPSTAILCLLLQRYTFWSNSQPKPLFIRSARNCACYCKDTHFEAIHNYWSWTVFRFWIVLATAKIHILKQFTTRIHEYIKTHYCACYCKDTHFEAIHNWIIFCWYCSAIVLATAKIHILKQFTTHSFKAHSFYYCACYCKDTHFEAIHNITWTMKQIKAIVLATAKIHILKQFTTTPLLLGVPYALCLLLQRYTFWSNSQRVLRPTRASLHCACYCKDTHFEAIHNSFSPNLSAICIVLATAKIHILKQFTTMCRLSTADSLLCLLLQRYTFWSNSQQNHTNTCSTNNCACYCKDTHFEAIHNFRWFVQLQGLLCLLLQRYTFWSNSQRMMYLNSPLLYCACYCKDTHFEAIHNRCVPLQVSAGIVLATAKIHILKQFTTRYFD